MNGRDETSDLLILLARIMLVALFIQAGWSKLFNYPGLATMLTARGVPSPSVAAVFVIAVELLGGLAILLGIWTRPLALLMAVYTIATAFIGHRFWELDGPARAANLINFYKNWSIAGGFLLLAATGPGRFALDNLRTPRSATDP